MGGQPKEPKPSESEMALAEVGVHQSNKHRTLYDPLAKAESKDALSDDIRQTMRNRTSADVAQSRKDATSYAAVTNPTVGIESTMDARKKATQKSDTAAKQIQDKRLTTAVSTAQKQGGKAQNALSSLAEIGTKESINKMERDQQENAAAWKAGTQLASAAYMMHGPDGKMKDLLVGLSGMDDDAVSWLAKPPKKEA